MGFVLFLLFASLFPLAKRKSGWGICGSSFLVWLWFLFLLIQSICRLQGPFVLAICISCLLSCKDRAFSATSAKLEEKKSGYGIHSDRPPKFEPFQSSQPCLWGRQCRCVGLLLSAPPWPYQNNLPCLPGRHLLTSGRLRVTCQLLHHICLIPLTRRDVKI